jgi:outer membrane protein assembly factor BamB
MQAFRLLTPLLLLAAIPGASAAWTSFHGDERNTGFLAGSDYKLWEDIWWDFELPNAQVKASIVESNGVVVIADSVGQLRAYDAQSGTIKWNATYPAGFESTPAIADGRVYASDTAGNLKVFDLNTGALRDAEAVGATAGAIKIHEGKLYIGNDAGEMKAYHATQSGLDLDWKFLTSSVKPDNATSSVSLTARPIKSAPVVYEKQVIFTALNDWVYSVSEDGQPDQTTRPQWLFQTGDSIWASPAIDASRGRVIVASYDAKVYAMDATPTGQGPIYCAGSTTTICSAKRNTASWTHSLSSNVAQIHSSPATDGTLVYFGANDNRVYAIQAGNGKYAHDFLTGAKVSASPAISNGIVVVASEDRHVYWLASNLTLLKKHDMGAAITSSPAISGDRTFVASFEGYVAMFGPKIPTQPDLQVSGVSYTGGVLTVVVTNAGDGEAAASKLRISIDGSLAGDFDVPVLAAGAQHSVTHSVDLDEGSHAVIATADQAGSVVESAENNNEKSQSVTVRDETSGKKKDGGGIKIPATPWVLVALGLLATVAIRRRK